MTTYSRYTLAAIQAAPILFDRDASTEKACQLIQEASDTGATIAAFGEAWLPGYPFFAGASLSPLWWQAAAEYLANAVESPERPFVAILGGAKVSDKIGVIESLLGKCDKLLIGGGMANTFYKAQGIEMGYSLVEEDAIDTAKDLLGKSGDKLVLPEEVVIADAFDNDANTQVITVTDGVPEGWRILDISAGAVEAFREVLEVG